MYRGDKISCDTGTVSNRKSVRVKISTEAPPLELDPWNELVKMTYSLNDILGDVISTSPLDHVIMMSYSNVWLGLIITVIQLTGVESLALTETCSDINFHVYWYYDY